ncbi:MAG: cytochrome c oxidase accessory protein CcoG [Candidatus Eremiobacteraeota bacterium]|nr:cytochrome c oxidase accessory protein CcoG [Candidatus Eremiobacteraeota bacterium]MCW5871035.1 cytochrome c oxidase accessory protein CcoG [Candidatus Eremiobacteraeota bacterium]
MILPGQQMTAARKKIYPRNSPGRFRNLRNVLSVLLQALLFALPWLQWHSRQAVLADLAGRKLYLFDLVLHPQDNYFLLLITIIAVLLISGVSTLAGRMWCGFACPQTIFTQAFIAVERFFEGDRAARMRLDRAAWNGRKIRAKVSKWIVWTIMGSWLGMTFAGYFLPIRDLMGQILSGHVELNTGLVVLFFTAISLFDFGYFREQFCQHICPYARLQSTMLDADSIIVGYDSKRGEPRAKLKQPDRGACVDCSLCVQVCPAGIDIRDGLQSECIGCTACIDACDSIMDKVKQPRGLIRFTSLNELEGRPTRVFRPRLLIYSGALVLLTGLLLYLMVTRSPIGLECERQVRPGGQMAAITADGRVSNVFKVHVVNRLAEPARLQIRVEGLAAGEVLGTRNLELASGQLQELQLLVVVPAASGRGIHNFRFVATSQAGVQVSSQATFFVP